MGASYDPIFKILDPQTPNEIWKNNLTPEQLWTVGLQSIAHSQTLLAKEVFEDFNEVSY